MEQATQVTKTRHVLDEQGRDSDGVDLRAALLPQLAGLEDRYDAWVHDSVPPNTATKLRGDSTEKWAGSLRVFKSDWLEVMSHIPWQLVLIVWVPIVVALFAGARFGYDLALGPALAWCALGAFVWTLVEYSLHRWIFHYKPRSQFGRKFHFLAHGIHHLDPWDGTRLVFPPLPGLMIAGLIFLAMRLALPMPAALACMSGLLIGYIAYDMTHYYTHHARPKSRWGKFLKRYHLAHHHKAWEAMYGVSQPLWDIVFRTTEPRE
jgi:sterol desaturase/sphingolipid hydroxylase (fatty acid hydroxylase superfamily)